LKARTLKKIGARGIWNTAGTAQALSILYKLEEEKRPGVGKLLRALDSGVHHSWILFGGEKTEKTARDPSNRSQCESSLLEVKEILN